METVAQVCVNGFRRYAVNANAAAYKHDNIPKKKKMTTQIQCDNIVFFKLFLYIKDFTEVTNL